MVNNVDQQVADTNFLEGMLARISHYLATSTGQWSALAGFRSVGEPVLKASRCDAMRFKTLEIAWSLNPAGRKFFLQHCPARTLAPSRDQRW